MVFGGWVSPFIYFSLQYFGSTIWISIYLKGCQLQMHYIFHIFLWSKQQPECIQKIDYVVVWAERLMEERKRRRKRRMQVSAILHPVHQQGTKGICICNFFLLRQWHCQYFVHSRIFIIFINSFQLLGIIIDNCHKWQYKQPRKGQVYVKFMSI